MTWSVETKLSVDKYITFKTQLTVIGKTTCCLLIHGISKIYDIKKLYFGFRPKYEIRMAGADHFFTKSILVFFFSTIRQVVVNIILNNYLSLMNFTQYCLQMLYGSIF